MSPNGPFFPAIARRVALTVVALALAMVRPAAANEPAPPVAPSAVSAKSTAASTSDTVKPQTASASKKKKPRQKNGARPRKRKKRAGGINPCMTPDPGWGIYDRWSRAPSMGQMIAPKRGGLTKRGGFDLVVHFHGHYPVRKEFVRVAKGPVLVAIDLGVGSGAYSRAFASPQAFVKLLRSVEKEMAKRSGRRRTYVRRLALSAWSAGYGAIAQILRQPAGKKVDALILLDSVYGNYETAGSKQLQAASLKPFVRFARQAARGRKFMFQTYSSIEPPGYASTKEVGRYIIKKLGGRPRRGRRNDRYGLLLFERYDRRGYHARGYRGKDKPDHCAHIGMMRDILRVHLKRRWRSPRGYGTKRKAISRARSRALRSGKAYVVQRGDHLGGIARKYAVTVSALREANQLQPGSPIRVGQELMVPKPKGRGRQQRTKQAVRVPRGARVHVVADGQTLGSIARRYNVTVAWIRQANKLRKRAPIRPGQKLIIPPRPKKRGHKRRR